MSTQPKTPKAIIKRLNKIQVNLLALGKEFPKEKKGYYKDCLRLAELRMGLVQYFEGIKTIKKTLKRLDIEEVHDALHFARRTF